MLRGTVLWVLHMQGRPWTIYCSSQGFVLAEFIWSVLGPCSENERLTLERCCEYLSNDVYFAEHRRVRIECDLVGFTGRRILGELNQWILQLHLDILIGE